MAIGNYGELKTATENWLGGRSDLTSRVPEWIAMAEDRIAQDLRVRAMEARGELLWKATTSITAAEVGGTADAITFTPATAATSYAFADTYKFTAEADNTGTATVNISSLGAKTIKKYEEGAKQDLAARDILNGIEYRLYYDGTDFLLIPQGGAPLPTRFVALRRGFLNVDTGKRLPFVAPTRFWNTAAVAQTAQPDMFTIEGDYLIVAPVPDATLTARLLYWKRLTALSGDSDTNWILSNARGLLLYGTRLEASIYLKDRGGELEYAALYEDLLERVMDADRKDRYPDGPLESRSEVSGP